MTVECSHHRQHKKARSRRVICVSARAAVGEPAGAPGSHPHTRSSQILRPAVWFETILLGGMQQPLIPSPETRADYGARYAARRVRVLRFVVAFFVLAIIVGAVLTTIRLNHIASRQVYIDNSFPACRKGYALGAYTEPESGDRRLLVWSGKADNNCMWSNELCDDTWLFDANVDSPLNGTSKWTHIDKENDGAYLQSNKRPEPRWKTIAVQDEAANMYIFAGDPLRANGAFIDDVWKLDAATMRWEQLAPTCEDLIDTEDACNALPRRAHAAAYMRGSIYMHGGKNEASDLLNDMWSLNLRTMRWTLLHDVRARRARTRTSLAPLPASGSYAEHSAQLRLPLAPAPRPWHCRAPTRRWRSNGRRPHARGTRLSRSTLWSRA